MRWRAGLLLAAMALVVAGCSGSPSPTGTVRGTFEGAGGPAIIKNGKAETPVFPLSGTVTFTDSGGHATSVPVGKTGTFSVRLPAGTYHVAGRTPSVGEANSNGTSTPIPCLLPAAAQVRAGQTAQITVVCAYP